MTDIVERLRRLAEEHYEMLDDVHLPMNEAADEITALRAEVERLNKSRNKWGQKYNKLLEKHRVTRAEMANQIQWVKDLADNLIAEEAKTSALRAENERLRAALSNYACTCKDGECAEQTGYRDECGKPARAALEETKHE